MAIFGGGGVAESQLLSETCLSQLLYLGPFHPDDATCQALVDQQAKLAVKINPAVMLILKKKKRKKDRGQQINPEKFGARTVFAHGRHYLPARSHGAGLPLPGWV